GPNPAPAPAVRAGAVMPAPAAPASSALAPAARKPHTAVTAATASSALHPINLMPHPWSFYGGWIVQQPGPPSPDAAPASRGRARGSQPVNAERIAFDPSPASSLKPYVPCSSSSRAASRAAPYARNANAPPTDTRL